MPVWHPLPYLKVQRDHTIPKLRKDFAEESAVIRPYLEEQATVLTANAKTN